MTRRMLGDAGHGTDPTTVSDTVRAGAGLVVEQHGWAQEAIDHALAARNVTRAVGLIARHWYATVDAGRAATVAGWLRSLGDDQIAASPLAAHCMAWTAALTGDRETVRRCLPVIEASAYDGALPDGMRSLRSSAALLVGTFGITGLAATREAAARAMELESDPASPWYGVARAAFGTAQYFSGEFRAATRQLEEALICGLPAAFIRLYALTVMTVIAVQEGRLEQAHEMARAARELATDPVLGLRDAPQGSLARIAAGAVDAATGRLEEARSEFRHAQLSRRPWPGLNPWADFEIQLRLAPVLLQLDDRSGAEALVGQARTLLASFPEGAEAQQDRLVRLERRLTGAAQAATAGETLTEREQQVLWLLQGTFSLREIGQELHLSTNTIKTHNRAVYRKLGVSGRDDAVARGRELGIIFLYGPPVEG
jgi:LuxR family maltose regulon positive regulatory protein